MATRNMSSYPSQMLAEVVAWIGSVKMTSAEIAEAAGVNKWWVDRMRRGAVPDPGIRRVQAVYDAMRRHEGTEEQREVNDLGQRIAAKKEELAKQMAELERVGQHIERVREDVIKHVA